jgi:steroid delta-isomerase-like uncharacterized protein
MKREELEKIATNWIAELWQVRDLDAIDRLHTQDFKDYSPSGTDFSNAGYKKSLTEFFKAFPDFNTEIEYLVVDEVSQKVAIRWTATGTHTTEFMGVAETLKEIEFIGIEILTILDGKVSERWGEWDLDSILEQLEE